MDWWASDWVNWLIVEGFYEGSEWTSWWMLRLKSELIETVSGWINAWMNKWVSELLTKWVGWWVCEWMKCESKRVCALVREWVSEWIREVSWLVSKWVCGDSLCWLVGQWVKEWMKQLVGPCVMREEWIRWCLGELDSEWVNDWVSAWYCGWMVELEIVVRDWVGELLGGRKGSEWVSEVSKCMKKEWVCVRCWVGVAVNKWVSKWV